MPTTQTHSAILFIIFNRPDTTKRVFEKIREARPPRLYIAADGPRQSKPADTDACEQARAAAGPIDWPCQLTTLYRKENLGCKEAVSTAIDWFFQHEEEGIILEDDCLASPEFFSFCDTLLTYYRHDTRVRHICGCNFQFGQQRGPASYYFSRLTHVWGWASWRRAWHNYDKNLSNYAPDEIANALTNIFDDPLIVERWSHIASELRNNRINTWDYQLALINLLQNGLCIIPNANLITNIGFGPNATHTANDGARYANIPHDLLPPLSHPNHYLPHKDADFFTLNEEFQLAARQREREQQTSKQKRLKYKIKRWIAAHGGPSRWSKAGG